MSQNKMKNKEGKQAQFFLKDKLACELSFVIAITTL
jgi:hypothetical protein